MSSPASSATSTKAGTLSHPKRKQQRSSSFPALAGLKSFRKKTLPKPHSPRDPFEVAPGILNTDASAKVFGYVDTDDEPTNSRKQSVKSKKRDQVEPAPDKPAPIRSGRRGMRMVSSDDRLTARGANPRTGLVSPFVTSDSEASHGHDYMTAARSFVKVRTRSGKWKQGGLGWSLVESPLLSPIAQSTNGPPTRQVSVKELEDKLLVEMPSLDNPEPVNLTDQQVRQYQEQMARIRRQEGSDAIVDPDTLPSPRQWTPEGPSTPPKKLHKIFKRKKVGSGIHARDCSTEKVVVNEQKRASSMPTPRHGVREQQRVRIITPSNTPRELSSDTGVKFKDPFLGQRQVAPPDQTQIAAQFQYPQTKPQEVAHRQSPPQRPSPFKEDCPVPRVIPTLSQCLPHIHFQHPSEFANLGSPSYRRPNQLLPARLRPLDQQKKLVEDACISISTFTTTSAQKPSKDQRPRLQRQDGNNAVPRAIQPPQESEVSKENHPQVQADTPMQRQRSFTNFKARSQESTRKPLQKQPLATDMKTRTPDPTTKTQRLNPGSANKIMARCPDSSRRVHSLGAGSTAKMAWSPGPTTNFQGLSLGSADIVREPVQKSQRDGVGTTHTYALPGNQPAKFAVWNDVFTGHWAEVREDEDDGISDQVDATKDKLPVRRHSMGKEMAGVWVDAVEGQLRLSTKMGYVQQGGYDMLCYVFLTLHHLPSAVKVLRTPDVRAQDYLIALKDVVLAGAYIVVLLIALMVARKVAFMVARVLYWVLHPMDMVLTVLKWCIMS